MKKKSMLIVAILLMSIGFAAVSTTLIINGNAKVSENQDDFSVIFTAASLDGKDVYSSVVDDTKKIITFETSELKTLNQTSILTYEVTNNSSNYDAEVKITCVPKDGTTAKYTSIKNKLDNDAKVVKAKETLNGTLTITLDQVATENVTEEYTCKLEFNAVERDTIGIELTQFQKDSWSTIAANVKSGNTSKYNVGDTKEVSLPGSLGTNKVRIANMSECTNGETSETACGFVVEFMRPIIAPYDHPAWDYSRSTMGTYEPTNVGGWKDSGIRKFMNGNTDTYWLFNSLPSDLQSVITTTKVISSHGSTEGETNFETEDKLYLLSGEEIYSDFSSSSYAENDTSVGTSRQLDYYKNQGVTTSNYAGADKGYFGWWLRSVPSYSDKWFSLVLEGGKYWPATDNSAGLIPAFRIA